ncbi:universal stress protein [Halorubrum yunnanense]|uniref:Universal stress protein n=1 Tax=Halorubrum yunnanense TaxID=1526162 RepID=A0ABD5YD77_9EURY|nr:universal stress protein [Halorubrum yunnanense]
MHGSDTDEASAEAPAVGDRVGEPVVEPAVGEAAASTTAAAHARLNGIDRATRRDRVSSILVAVGAGPHTGATVDVAREVADATDAWLELFHVVPSDEALVDGDATAVDGEADGADEYAAAGDRLLDAARDRLGDFDRVDRWLVEDRTAAGAIVEQSPYYDLVVVGAPTTGTVGRFVFGSTTDTVIEDAEVPVVVVEADGETSLDVG